jgi:hypothetical protein
MRNQTVKPQPVRRQNVAGENCCSAISDAPKCPECQQAIGDLHNSLDIMQGRVEALEARLTPVLGSEPLANEGQCGPKHSAPLAVEISSKTSWVYELGARLERLLSRLEV